jgi:hypothetical protein
MSNGNQVLTRLCEQVSPNFDTPQKSNKAATSHSFDKDTMQQLKEGGLTLEILGAISKKVPVFKSLDQVAIHGRFSKSQVEQIVGYNDGLRLDSNLLIVKYNQLDVKKKMELGEMLQLASTYKENYVVPIMQKEPIYGFISFQLVTSSLLEAKKVYDRIDTSLFYGRKELFQLSDPSDESNISHLLSISLNAMKQENLWAIFSNWTDMSARLYNKLKKEAEEAQRKAEEERLQKEQEKQQRCEENYKKAISQLKRFQPWAGIMNNNIVLVSGLKEEDSTGFVFVKLQEASKGNITMYTQIRKELIGFSGSNASYETLSPLELSKALSAQDWFLYDVGDRVPQKTEAEREPVQLKKEAASQDKELELFHYSASSIALFGDTTAYKEMLYEDPFQGVPNRRLTHPVTNKKIFGWIFSNDQETIEAVEKQFSITIKGTKKQVA